MKLSKSQKVILYVLCSALFISGAAKALYQYILQPDGPFTPGYSELEQVWLTAHGILSPLYLVALGALIPVHMKRSWAAGRNQASGVFIVTIHLVLIATGLGLYYAGTESLRAISVSVHLWIGLGLPLILIGHVLLGRTSRKF